MCPLSQLFHELRTDPVRIVSYLERRRQTIRETLEVTMQHPDFTQQLASDRQAHYRTQAAKNRLTQPARGHERVTRSRTSNSSSRETSFVDETNPWFPWLRLRARP